jgi:hypothetical protein
MARRQRDSLQEAAPALAAELAVVVAAAVDTAAAVADMVAVVTGNSSIIVLLTVCQVLKWRETVCGQQS